MDYVGDINKFVLVEFSREGQSAVVKGRLVDVKKEGDRTFLKIVNVVDPAKVNIIATDNLNSYFARPFKEDEPHGQ